MGREIRKVPPHWDHPKNELPGRDDYQPMYDENFSDATREWKDGLAKWEAGDRPDHCTDEFRSLEYWEWEGDPPDRAYYRPWTDDEATWFQVWETVSEGTPVTPPFETKAELVAYLVEHGDFWDQRRGNGGWQREAAERFVGSGWAPSLIAVDGRTYAPRDGSPL